MVKKIFILAILLLVLSSCRNEEEIFLDLDMPRRTYTGKELRTDGYYYSGYIHTNKMGTLMLFRNGVCMFTYFDYRYGDATHYIENDKWGNKSYMNEVRSKPDGIGVFSVLRNVLEFQIFFSGSGRVTQNCTGEILNDTTLRLTSWRYNRYGHVENIDELYYFKAFNNKPDSTSSFIK